MTGHDARVIKLKIETVEDFAVLISKYLCDRSLPTLSSATRVLLKHILASVKSGGLNYEQFNELLLVLDQNRVNRGFFNFFFGDRINGINGLKEGIGKFRIYAMLCFGNFGICFEELKNLERDALEKILRPHTTDPDNLLKAFSKRPKKVVDIVKLAKDETWLTGYISSIKLKKEVDYAKNNPDKFTIEEEKKLRIFYDLLNNDSKKAEQLAFDNTEVYLTWDYLDVYVATSMRQKWEFESTYELIHKIFDDPIVRKLKIRYFDPTQCKSKDRIDKGLIEGLMLKRSVCTIYMAQEYDTFGKDSELASTLAQSKPVIAFVPEINVPSYEKLIRSFPLDYFEQRVLLLRAEGIFDELEVQFPDLVRENRRFIDSLKEFREQNPLSLYPVFESKFKSTHEKLFHHTCHIVAIAEKKNFDKRAILLRDNHPLSLQVDLSTGVANGVLVVRNAKDCLSLLVNILTNRLEFVIEDNDYSYILKEKISQSPFRVITKNTKLTNSFWNFYK